jgi:hypothetical protein
MALKPDREEFHHDIRWYMGSVAERGGVVCLQTADSGGYPGAAKNTVVYAANPSGRHPIGLLLQDVVNNDLSRTHPNWYRDQVQINSKVALMKDGWVTTNMVDSSTPVGGEAAYLGASGLFSTTQATGAPKVGQFLTSKDQDGYVAVRVQLQV